MSFSAFVHCNCWFEGKAAPLPPTVPPQFVSKTDDRSGLQVNLPIGSSKSDQDTANEDLYSWTEDCCAHQSTYLVDEFLGRTQIVDSVLDLLRTMKSMGFPALRSMLEDDVRSQNPTRPTCASTALVELEALEPLIGPECELKWIIHSLLVLCKASVETGNNIVWVY